MEAVMYKCCVVLCDCDLRDHQDSSYVNYATTSDGVFNEISVLIDHILMYCRTLLFTGSCRPFRRSAQQHHVYETGRAGVKREFLFFACILT